MDESQSFGVLGATGRGITEHFDVDVRDYCFIIAFCPMQLMHEDEKQNNSSKPSLFVSEKRC